jgi:NADPH-dependent glutamate synthase beta subunit-like oxidoreductase/NAD-dependent dihydropyrimidine dehydrogenase PreA subunit
MKSHKERLHRVVVIGATPAGIAAANKMGELGIPVTLVDSEADLDRKLAREEWRLKSGLPFNHAYRPGLIRIMRNPDIRCIFPATVTAIKHSSQGFRVSLKALQTFVDAERCVLCGRCAEVCPVSIEGGQKAVTINSRRSLPGRPVIDKRKTPYCQINCPLGVNAQGYIALTRVGKFHEALALIKRDNVLPGICGRICTHPCEAACRRGELDEPIAIRSIKRFLADYELDHPLEVETGDMPQRSETIAVVGSGPAGLAAATDFVRLGYAVTVFEKEDQPGGLLRYGIGAHRLPRDILEIEIDYIRRMGVEFRLSHPVDLSGDMETLKDPYKAVVLTTGSWQDRSMGVPGEDLPGVEGGLAFLNRFYRGDVLDVKGRRVAVVGDGNGAFDLARTLVRLGAEVTLLSWFPEDRIPADPSEVHEAREESITILNNIQVVAFLGKDNRLTGLRCMTTRLGKTDTKGIVWPEIVPETDAYELDFEQAFVAVGQAGPFHERGKTCAFETTAAGFIKVDSDLQTSIRGIYATGDAVYGPTSVVEAMAAGREAARRVHDHLHSPLTSRNPKQLEGTGNRLPVRPEAREFRDIPEDLPLLSRPMMPERQPAARKSDFSEVALGLTERQVISEAERCLQCGVCSECLQCVDACQALGAIDHAQCCEEILEQAGVVIVADPQLAPSIKGEDVIRAYAPKAAKTDADAMIIRGFAAAAQAMVLLGKTQSRPRGHGLAFSAPAPALSPEIRIGVFVCRCNDSLGWMEEMSDYIAQLPRREKVIHAEMMNAACVAEGTAHILRTIREKGITRVVLASCVCCPLNFVCSACTDQRSRLKTALFTGTGISRQMVETCNLRGEVLRLIRQNPDLALKHFCGLLERSLLRAEKLIFIPQPARDYNFAIAVIGVSEQTRTSALTLAAAGLEVLWFKNTEDNTEALNAFPNLVTFDMTAIKGVSGTLGDFRLSFESGDGTQVRQVGAVILGEKARKKIPYFYQEALPSMSIDARYQKKDVPGVPFLYPGVTAIPGIYLADQPGIQISKRRKGAAAAVLAAAVMPRGPRKSKGFTVTVDPEMCRGCGRCVDACPYHAITLHPNEIGGWYAAVDQALCKGCGNCISVCPSNAADSPYRNQAYLEEMLEELLVN